YNANPLTNPSQQGEQYRDVKLAYTNQMLRSWRFETNELHHRLCNFCGNPATIIASRGQIPLLNGETIMNFSPQGQPGLPICGYCSLAIHAIPLGSLKSAGRVLTVYTDDTAWTSYWLNRGFREVMQ